jgi:hypothetical protein
VNIVSTNPNVNATYVPLDVSITITFDTALLEESIHAASIVVGTEKPNIYSVGSTGINPNQPFYNDDFFDQDFTAVVQGKISISSENNMVLIFKPNRSLSRNTKYKVFIAEDITGINTEHLSAPFYFEFTTVDEDIVLPVEPIETTPKLIDNEVYFHSNLIDLNYLNVLSTRPNHYGFFVRDNEIEIEFSETLPSEIEELNSLKSHIKIFNNQIFSDEQDVKITSYTLSASGKVLTITLPENIFVNNSIFSIKLLNSFEINDKSLKNDFTLMFLTALTPYHTTTKLIKLKAGSLLSNLNDFIIALSIYWASIEAEHIFKKNSIVVGSDKQVLKGFYTFYSTLVTLLLNTDGEHITDSIKKQLAEYSIHINTSSKIKLYNEFLREAKKNLDTIKYYITIQGKSTFKFFEDNYNSSDLGRSWARWTQNPGLNDKSIVHKQLIFNELNLFN